MSRQELTAAHPTRSPGAAVRAHSGLDGSRIAPSRDGAQSFRLRYLPGLIGVSYVLVTLFVFLIWPFEWRFLEPSTYLAVFTFVVIAAVLYGVGQRTGSSGSNNVQIFPYVTLIVLTGAALSVVMSFVGANYYTGGRTPLDLLDALNDQRDVYQDMLLQLQETQGSRFMIAMLRAAVYPLVFGGLVMGLYFWGRLSWLVRAATIVNLLMFIVTSILRGTDFGLFSALVVLGGVVLIRLGQTFNAPGTDLSKLKRKLVIAGIIGTMLATVMVSVFTYRKSERMAGSTQVCFVDAGICADLHAPVLSWMPEDARVQSTMLVAYVVNGYYGLSLAIQQPWLPTFGLGHSLAVASVYEALTGDHSFRLATFESRNGDFNWSSAFFWSSAWTSFANDVGWLGALVVTYFFGKLVGATWRDATLGENPSAAILFVLLLQQVMFLPANAITFVSMDNLMTLYLWLGVWLLWRSQRGPKGGAKRAVGPARS